MVRHAARSFTVRQAWPLAATLVLALALTLACGCTGQSSEREALDLGWAPVDSGGFYPDKMIPICQDPDDDYDSDGILNGEEGGLSSRDTDGDGVPDCADSDSDGDKVQDHVEKGKKDLHGRCKDPIVPAVSSWPCDSDGDKVPDYLDPDSDNDGLLDGLEDENGDGLLGCCLEKCNTPGSYFQQWNCTFNSDGCGKGQSCVSGRCTPPVAFLCSGGETDPRRKDTFGDGRPDGIRGTFICRDGTEDRPRGRRPVMVKMSYATQGDWNVALEKTASYKMLSIAEAPRKMYAAAIDHYGSTEEVAGFVLSRDTTTDVQTELTTLISILQASPPGGSKTRVTLRAPGTRAYNHRLFDSVKGTVLDLTLASASDVSSVRNAVVASFLEKPLSDLTQPPRAYGASSASMVLRFATVKRVQLKRDKSGRVMLDASGKPLETGDTTKWRLMVIGAVASRINHQNPARPTGLIVEDLSNTTALTIASDRSGNACEVAVVAERRIADLPPGGTSSVVLDQVPISATLAATRDGVAVIRGHALGFDYRAASNTLVFPGLKHHRGSEVIISYRRWEPMRHCWR